MSISLIKAPTFFDGTKQIHQSASLKNCYPDDR